MSQTLKTELESYKSRCEDYGYAAQASFPFKDGSTKDVVDCGITIHHAVSNISHKLEALYDKEYKDEPGRIGVKVSYRGTPVADIRVAFDGCGWWDYRFVDEEGFAIYTNEYELEYNVISSLNRQLNHANADKEILTDFLSTISKQLGVERYDDLNSMMDKIKTLQARRPKRSETNE